MPGRLSDQLLDALSGDSVSESVDALDSFYGRLQEAVKTEPPEEKEDDDEEKEDDKGDDDDDDDDDKDDDDDDDDKDDDDDDEGEDGESSDQDLEPHELEDQRRRIASMVKSVETRAKVMLSSDTPGDFVVQIPSGSNPLRLKQRMARLEKIVRNLGLQVSVGQGGNVLYVQAEPPTPPPMDDEGAPQQKSPKKGENDDEDDEDDEDG